MTKSIIMKVRENKNGNKVNQKIVTVPQDCNIKSGDYVKLVKVK